MHQKGIDGRIYFSNMGKFLPLSVWSTMGYDAEAIEANNASKDIRFDPVLRKVYRVMTMVTGDRGNVGTTSSEAMSSKGDGKSSRDNPSRVQELTQELAKLKKAQREREVGDKKKLKSIGNIGKVAMTIRNSIALHSRAFSDSVLDGAKALLDSADNVASETDVKAIV